MMGMSSTLVETVSINYEDFNESFLTCGTCLLELSRSGMYDGQEHTPKLLPCSHTVCLHCLSRIAASQTRDNGTFRCPICRELITIPRGGVAALPPSFLVNQLLDLMSRQRREVIPKCSIHINQELLFCETCDTVFCNLCTAATGHQSQNGSQTPGAEHTIIPFSIAIKRMSEILLYKANECISKLTHARDTVQGELQRLESATERTVEQVNGTINEILSVLEARRQELLAAVATVASEKRKVLEEQLTIIDGEKEKVERECEGLQYQVEVRNITQKVSQLAEKLDAACSLSEPRENSFLTCDFAHNDAIQTLPQQFKRLGRVRTSTTFPNLCKYEIEEKILVANLSSSVILHTVDYRGNPRTNGGDPVVANLVKEGDSSVSVPVAVQDLDNGSYRLSFRAHQSGRYHLNVYIFDRLIRDCPIVLDVTEHNNPVKSFGIKGSGKDGFLQPVAVAIDPDTNFIYVVDTGNSRIKVLNADLEFLRHIENEGLEGRSCTGIDVTRQGLAVVNWRTKTVTSMDFNGTTLSKFMYNGFQEPIDLCVDREYGHILVADNGLCAVLVFDSVGKFLFQVGKQGTVNSCFSLISSLCMGPGSSIVVADAKLHVFSPKGDVLEGLPETKGRGRFGGVAVDKCDRVVVAKTEKNKNTVQVWQLSSGELLSSIDSNEVKLKRPGGLAVTNDCHVIVVDLGNDCVRKYRYY